MNTHAKTKRQPKKVSRKSMVLKKLIKNKLFKYLYLSFRKWEINTKNLNYYEKNRYKDNQEYEEDYEDETDENQYKNITKSSRIQPKMKFSAYTESKSRTLSQIFSPNEDIINNKIKEKKFVLEWGTGSIKRTVKKEYEKASTRKKKPKIKINDEDVIPFSNDGLRKTKIKNRLANSFLNVNESVKKTRIENTEQYKYNLDEENFKDGINPKIIEIIQKHEKNKNKRFKNKKENIRKKNVYNNWTKNQENKIILKKLINKMNKKFLSKYFDQWFEDTYNNQYFRPFVNEFEEKSNGNNENLKIRTKNKSKKNGNNDINIRNNININKIIRYNNSGDEDNDSIGNSNLPNSKSNKIDWYEKTPEEISNSIKLKNFNKAKKQKKVEISNNKKFHKSPDIPNKRNEINDNLQNNLTPIKYKLKESKKTLIFPKNDPVIEDYYYDDNENDKLAKSNYYIIQNKLLNEFDLDGFSKSNNIVSTKQKKKLKKINNKKEDKYATIDDIYDIKKNNDEIFKINNEDHNRIRNKSQLKYSPVKLGDSYLKQRSINYSKEDINPDVNDIQIRQEDETESEKRSYLIKKYKSAMHLLRKAIRNFQKRQKNLTIKDKIKVYFYKWYKISKKYSNNIENDEDDYNFNYGDYDNDKNKIGYDYDDNDIKMVYDNDEDNKENYKEENENIFNNRNNNLLHKIRNNPKKNDKYKFTYNFTNSSYDKNKHLYNSQIHRDKFRAFNDIDGNNFYFENIEGIRTNNSLNELNLKVKTHKKYNSIDQKYSKGYNSNKNISRLRKLKVNKFNGFERHLTHSYDDNTDRFRKRKKSQKDFHKIKNMLFILLQNLIKKNVKIFKDNFFLKWYDLTFNSNDYPPFQLQKKKSNNANNKNEIYYDNEDNLYNNNNDPENNNVSISPPALKNRGVMFESVLSNNTIPEETKSQNSQNASTKKLKTSPNINVEYNEDEDFEFHYEDSSRKLPDVEEKKQNGVNSIPINDKEKNNTIENEKNSNNNKKFKKTNTDNLNGSKVKKTKISKNKNNIRSNYNISPPEKLNIEEYLVDKNAEKIKMPEIFNEIKKTININCNINKMINNSREGIKEKLNINSYLNIMKQHNKLIAAYQLYFFYFLINDDITFYKKKYFLFKWKKNCKIFNNDINNIMGVHSYKCVCNVKKHYYKGCICNDINIVLKKILIRHIFMKKMNAKRYYLFLWYKKCFRKVRDVFFIKEKKDE